MSCSACGVESSRDLPENWCVKCLMISLCDALDAGVADGGGGHGHGAGGDLWLDERQGALVRGEPDTSDIQGMKPAGSIGYTFSTASPVSAMAIEKGCEK